MVYAIELSGVKKSFGDVKALQGITLKAEQGTIYGLLGPNGAGKTTIVRMLSTLMKPDVGTATVLGLDVAKQQDKVRQVIGLAGQFAAVDEFQTGRENMHMVGRLYHMPKRLVVKRTNELLFRLHLEDAADRPARTYSGGMRRRLDLGASLVGSPKILYLDEPTTGLDPRTRLELWDIIKDLQKTGTSILLTTQYLEEADELADKMAVIDQGRLIAEGTSEQLKREFGSDVIEIEFKSENDANTAQQALKSTIKNIKRDEELSKLSLPTHNGAQQLTEVVRVLDNAKVKVAGLSLHRPSLDDVFLSLTGNPSKPQTKKGKK